MAKHSRKSHSDKRRRAFKKALVDEGVTLTEFARRLDVHRVHLSRAFANPAAASKRIHDAIDALIEKHEHSVVA